MIVLIYALLLLLSSTRAAAYENTTWIYPPGCEYCTTGLEIHYGDAMSVVWTSTWQTENDQNSLHMYCGKSNLEPIEPIMLTTNDTALQQTVPNSGNYTVQFENINLDNWPLPIQCHYSLGIGSYTGNGSSYFELLSQDPNLAPKTWSATASLSSTVPSTTTSTPASTTPASVNSSGSSTLSAAAQTIHTSEAVSAIQSSPSSSSGLSTSAKAGIGIGSAIGGLAILAALGIFTFCTRRRRQQQQQDKTLTEKGSFPSSSSDDLTTQGPYGMYSRKPELDAEQTKYEIAAADDGQKNRQQHQQHQHAKELDAAAAIKPALRAELEADGVSYQLD